MCLSVAIRILMTPSFCNNHYFVYEENSLKYFVYNFCLLFGKNQCVYNIHSLIHLPDDARQFGVLPNVSCFPFENNLGRLKKLVHRHKSPCSQIVRWILEGHLQQSKLCPSIPSKFRQKHLLGPLSLPFRHFIQYKQYFGPQILVSLATADNCFGVNDKVILVKNILTDVICSEANAFVVCQEF